jgi:hypothetical protein
MLNLYKREAIQENDTIKQLFKALVKGEQGHVICRYGGHPLPCKDNKWLK